MESKTSENTTIGNRYAMQWLFWLILLIAVIVVIVWLFGQQAYLAMNAKGYQAVFLTNGQVYFGKVSIIGQWIKLTDIYYLQVTQPLQQALTSEQAKNATPTAAGAAAGAVQSNIQLIKLGSELHGPTDVMYIEKDKVLFWENMKNDSKVVDAINKYSSTAK